MSNALDISKLSTAERLDLIGQLWDSLPTDASFLSPTDVQELQVRSAELDRDIEEGRPLGTPWAELRARLSGKAKR